MKATSHSNPSPVTHVTGMLYGLNMPWLAGTTVVLLDTWDPSRAFELMKRFGCTFCAGATPFLQDLIRGAEGRGESLPKMRRFQCGGAGCPARLDTSGESGISECHGCGGFLGPLKYPPLR